MSRPKIWGADGVMGTQSNDLEAGDLRVAVVDGAVRIDVYEDGAWVSGGVPRSRQTWRAVVQATTRQVTGPEADDALHFMPRPDTLIAVRFRIYLRLDAAGAARWTLAGPAIASGRLRVAVVPFGQGGSVTTSALVLPSPLQAITGTALREVVLEGDGIVMTDEARGEIGMGFGGGVEGGAAVVRRGSYLEATEL